MRIAIAEIDRFFLENNLPLIVYQGELIDFTVPKNEFNSLRSLDEYLIKFNLVTEDWEQKKIDYYDSKMPDWDTFNAIIMTNNYFNNLYAKLFNQSPLVISSLPASVLQISQEQYNLFRSIYQVIYFNAKPNEVEKWVMLAENCNLPYLFQKIIKNPFV